jgi:hypothetical protein
MYYFAAAHVKGCVVHGGLLVDAFHGDPGEEGTCIHREKMINSSSWWALVAACQVSLYPRDSILCLLSLSFYDVRQRPSPLINLF